MTKAPYPVSREGAFSRIYLKFTSGLYPSCGAS
nr:MAG TPA: hypothetical protein [Caudoviricetes sp.]